MFYFINDNDYISLKFKNDVLNISFEPQEPSELYEDGFNSGPSNGEFYFHHTDEDITFCCGKYGDGLGGTLNITVKMTSEIKESLDKAISEWRKYLENRNEDEDN